MLQKQKEWWTKKSLWEGAEEAVVSTEVCQICQFSFNHPTKQNKPLVYCPDCKTLVQQPCLEKSGVFGVL